MFIAETGSNIPVEATAILLKAMLTHGASWEPIAEKLALAMGASPKQLSKWLGNGVPNISRVIECTKERITLIGLGALKKDEGDIFRLPLPVDFSSRLMKRKLTVTLSYLSPIAPNKQTYRGAQLWFNIEKTEKDGIREKKKGGCSTRSSLPILIFAMHYQALSSPRSDRQNIHHQILIFNITM